MTVEMVTPMELDRLTTAMERIERQLASIQAGEYHRVKSLLTVRETAERLGLGESTIRNWQNDRKIPYRKIGGKVLFAEADIEAIINKGLVNPDPDKGLRGSAPKSGKDY